MKNVCYDYCIVGAGPSGLTAAYQLLKAGRSVLLLERDARIGGLAKSYNYGGHIFDTGPKRFHTDDPVVLDFIKEIMADDISTIERSTKVYFCDRYFEWPLRTLDLFKMPPVLAVQCAFDLLKERKVHDPASFREYIVSKYGQSLYATFFKPYTHKFLRWDVEDIHSDWASTGINRTVIDKRIKSNTLLDLFKTLLLPEKVKTEFLYPTQGGFGGFYERLLKRCQRHQNFQLLLNTAITEIKEQSEKFDGLTRDARPISFCQLIWTGNLNDLGRLLSSGQRVHYLNTIFYNLICRAEGINNPKAQWIYVSSGQTLISRITCMKEFAPYTCREGYYNLMCELTDSQTYPVYFHHPENYGGPILRELMDMSLLKGLKYVEDIKVNPVVDTYPIYHKSYVRDFAAAAGAVKKFSRRIHLLGRCGAFWYNNSDHSIRFAIELTKRLLNKEGEEFNYRRYFGGEATRSAHSQGVET